MIFFTIELPQRLTLVETGSSQLACPGSQVYCENVVHVSCVRNYSCRRTFTHLESFLLIKQVSSKISHPYIYPFRIITFTEWENVKDWNYSPICLLIYFHFLWLRRCQRMNLLMHIFTHLELISLIEKISKSKITHSCLWKLSKYNILPL